MVRVKIDPAEQTCPRRMTDFGPWDREEGLDHWVMYKDEELLHCDFCGSMHPDDFLKFLRDGIELGPTDKNYKAYLHMGPRGQDKFYYQHLDSGQRRELIEMANADQITFGYPGYWYVLPYFVRKI